MKRWQSLWAVVAVFVMCGWGLAAGQKGPRAGTVIVPPTSVEHRQDIGKRAHTNFLIFVPASKKGGVKPGYTGTAPSGETPGSLACIYQTVTEPAGVSPDCAINSATTLPTGGSKVIAIVDAYDYPTALNDFNKFSSEFGLPSGNSCGNGSEPCFQKTWPTGISQPQLNCGWAQEEALDIEWAHAMAPDAQIILVEAASSSLSDLLTAVQYANTLVSSAGGGEVSMSWGSSEFRSESTYDYNFTASGVIYVASSGDSGGKVIWPSASPNVISAGGTSVNRTGGLFTGESAWSSAGGGASRNEPVPDYQSSIYSLSQILGNARGTPDISFDADPYTGVSIYDSTSCQGYDGWQVFGGTSVSAPSLAGILNLSGASDGGWDGGTNSASVQNNLYQNYSGASTGGMKTPYKDSFYDVTSGSAGRYPAGNDWDYATGIGTVRGLTGLAAGSTSPGFSLSASPSSVSVTQGSTTPATSSISMTASGGFSGTVDLAASAGGSGLSVSLSSNSISGTATSTLSVEAGSATAGTYTVTVTGSGTDSSGNPLTSSTSVSVTVAQSSSGGDFSLSASPGNVTLHKGGTATYTITVTPSGGFDQPVSFAVSGEPSDPTPPSFSPPSVTGSGQTTLTVDVASGTKGSYTLTITGTSGTLIHAVTVGLKSH